MQVAMIVFSYLAIGSFSQSSGNYAFQILTAIGNLVFEVVHLITKKLK